jgi:mannose-6-phosphate isomerase-like protein (cupin superfamily)
VHASAYYAWIAEGLRLYEALAGREVIVVFPTASWTRWRGRRGSQPRSAWTREALETLGLGGVPARTNQDQRDAIAAAVTAREYSRGRTQAFGEIQVPCLRSETMEPIVVPPGSGHRLGNVEFLARTVDTPRFTFGIIEIAAGRELEAHVHADEDDAFYILEGEMTFVFGGREVPAPPGTFVLVPPGVEHGFRNDQDRPVRMLNIHAPAGFDRRIGLPD